ncbi:MAG: tryptophan synthase subunit alpha [Pseudomonadales bacterium]|nr:tryptophan synthase subunit alpha [Pseudomonadales bacterium]
MSRIKACFAQLQSQGRKALIPYITAGDPNLQTTLGLMHALVTAGADIIELGIPFTDPSADGPVIQRAVERALAKHTRLRDILPLVAEFRKENTTTPIVLMGYLNPIECMGYQAFANQAVAAGVDGVLTVDMPPEESHDFMQVLAATPIDSIFLVAPTTSEERAEAICRLGSGYVYYVSLKGVTGAGNLDVEAVARSLEKLRKHTHLPLGVGFGIKDADTAARISAIADAVVVGSALVNKVAELHDGTAYSQQQLLTCVALVSAMRKAMDQRQ